MYRYRYELKSKDPRTNRTHKVECPVCHAKKRFTEYWDNMLNEYVSGAGVCDRVNGCGAKILPSEVGDRIKCSVPTSYSAMYAAAQYKMMHNATATEIVPLNSLYEQWNSYKPDTLHKYLSDMFGDGLTRASLQKYCVTGDGHNGAAFWQTDGTGQASTARVICYTPDGHRDRNINPYWAHTQLQRDGKLSAGYQPPKYLFGLQLCTNGARVLIVESEKTAIMCHNFNVTHPDNDICGKYSVIMATGGATMLKQTLTNSAKILRAADCVVLCPDDDAAGETWKGIAESYKIGIDDTAHRTNEFKMSGWDIGDAIETRIIEEMNNRQIENYYRYE